MNWNEFPQQIGGQSVQLPLADWTNSALDWLLETFSVFFDQVSSFVLQMLLFIQDVLQFIPWPIFLLFIAIGAWFSTRSKITTIVLVALMFLVGSFGYWDLAMTTLAVIFASVIIAVVFGLPLGILGAQSNLAYTIMRPILDGMQTMPAFVYLIPALMFFGLGLVPAVFATAIYATPPMIRLTTLGIKGASESAVEASEAYGATSFQTLKEVKMPLALSAIMAGLNQTTMMALAMVVITSMIGAETIGSEVLKAISRLNAGLGAEAGLSIVALAIIIDRITQGFAQRYEESIS